MDKQNEKFYWGSATSSHQVEGDNFNSDWWEWEQTGKIKNNDRSGKACDFWNQYKEDLKLAKKLGHNAFRFSIEWAKIISKPQDNKRTKEQNSENFSLRSKNNRSLYCARDDKNINLESIKHYQEIVDYCHKLGLEPFVTLHHFTNPIWFSDLGGWEKKENIKYFTEYVNLVTKNIKGVKYWMSINEPCVYSSGSYVNGNWPPGKRSLFSGLKVVKNMITAHNQAYEIIKNNQPNSMVGFAKNNSYFEGSLAAKIASKYWNRYFLDKTNFDWIGLNYYFHNRLKLSIIPPFFKRANKNKTTTDLGWEVYPEGIYHVLKELDQYKKPIIITENGLADSEDSLRSDFIKNHLKWIFKAKSERVDIRGYLHWSLLDNFEWAEGFEPRFGLIKVDYKTQERTIRKSAYVYKNIIKKGLGKLDTYK